MYDWVIQIIGAVIGGGGVYAAIRADLREALVTARAALDGAAQANARIDAHLERGEK